VVAHFAETGLRTGGSTVLSAESLAGMRRPHASLFGREIYGLGLLLGAKTASGNYVFGHDGFNSPANTCAVRLNPDTDDAILIFSTGDPAFASGRASEWTYWQTERPDTSDLSWRLGDTALSAVLQTIAMLIALLLLTVLSHHLRRSRDRV
jgi:hypothetical protein